MAPNIRNFETKTFNPFHSDEFILNDERDPDTNFFDEVNTPNFDCLYFNTDQIKTFLSETEQYDNISALHVNIRSIKHNFDKLTELLDESKSSFNIVCLTETWCSDEEMINNSTLQLKGFEIIPYERKIKKREEE